MFQLPSYLSLLLDACIVIVYCNDPRLLGEDQRSPFANPWDPLRSYLILSVFAGCRIVLFLPYIWSYQKDRRLKMPFLPYIWHLTNIAVIAVKATDNLIVNEQNGYQWLFLLFASVSILCQCIALNHLKSTAIPEREVVLGMAIASPVLTDETRVSLLDPNRAHTSERQYSGDFVETMKKRMEIAHERWNQGISKFNQYVGIFNQDEFGPVFKHVVDLFRGAPGDEAVVALQQLFSDHPHELEFYIPQITIFLLYGSFQSSEILQELIFDLCSKSPTMAHKIRWFVVSFCLSGAGVGTVGVNVLNHFLSNVEKCGVSSSRRLILSAQPSAVDTSATVGSDHSGKSSSGAESPMTMSTVPLSQHAPWIQQNVQQPKETSYPLLKTIELTNEPSHGPAFIDAFSPTFNFWSDLVALSRELCPLSRDVRTATLRSKIDILKGKFLPSACIFAPVGRTQHRVWNILVEESFAFSTRERAPIFVCLEVVDYGMKWKARHEETRKWWDIGLTRSLKKAIDTFAESKDGETCSSPSRKAGTHDYAKPTSGQAVDLEQKKLRTVTKDEVKLGDRVVSASLLSELVADKEQSLEDLYEEYFATGVEPRDESAPGGLVVEQPVDIEAPDPNKTTGSANPIENRLSSFPRPRQLSLPNRWRDDEEIGQWALPSVSKSVMDRTGAEGNKHGFQGLTKWLSEAGQHLARPKEVKEPSDSSRRYNDIADKPTEKQSSEIDVFINTESMRVKMNTESESKASSSDLGGCDGAGGYGAVKRGVGGLKEPQRSISADAKLSSTSAKHIPIAIDEDMPDPEYSTAPANYRASYDEGDTHRLGHYRADPRQSVDVASMTSSQPLSSIDHQPLVVFKEPWGVKERRYRKKSAVGHLPGWRLFPVIIKSGDDLRQEQIVSQLMFQIYFILQTRKVGSWLRPYGIIATSPDSGVIEAIPDTVSLDVLRRRVPAYSSLIDFYERFYGHRDSDLFVAARDNFVKSLAGYSIVCYILQLKDRHNGNILIDNKGHLMHIDFGFVLGVTPGGNMGFEKAPFKLTREMIELMGGAHSAVFHKYRDLCVKTFMALRKEHHRIVLLLEMLGRGAGHLPCFQGNPQATLDSLKERFCPDLNDNAAIDRVHDLINAAANNWTTTCYDRYQRCCTGVF